MQDPEVVLVDVCAIIPPLDNILMVFRCGETGYTVNTFLREDGSIYVGSVLFVTNAARAGTEVEVPSFQQVVPDLRAVVDLVRTWHAEHAG